MKILNVLLATALVACGGCGAEPLEGNSPLEGMTDRLADAPPAVVDSVLPADEALGRFRADIPEIPTGLREAANSRQALFDEVLDLLAEHDTAGFERIALDRAEFAYLYYPSSPLSKAPYELPPALAWFRLQQQNRLGVLRMLREMGGVRFRDAELVCPDAPESQGENRIWTGCRIHTAGGEEVRLFGAMLERDGQWKLVTYANDF